MDHQDGWTISRDGIFLGAVIGNKEMASAQHSPIGIADLALVLCVYARSKPPECTTQQANKERALID